MLIPFYRIKNFRNRRQRNFWCILIGITIVALGIRIILSYNLKNHYFMVTQPSPLSDNYTYLQLAHQILHGTYDYQKGFYYQPFYYAVFLPVVWWIMGENIDSIIWAQSLLGAITVLIVGLLVAQISGRWAGILAALWVAIDRYLLFHTPMALIETVQAFFLTLSVWKLLKPCRQFHWYRWIGIGILFGISNLCRGNIVLLLPIFLIIIWWKVFLSFRLKLLVWILFLLGFFLPQLPFAWVNYLASGKWVGASTAGPIVFALGNSPEAPAGGLIYPPIYHHWVQQHLDESSNRISILTNAWNWIRREPFAWLELKLRMILLFWNQIEIPNNIGLTIDEKPIPAKLIHLPFPLLLDFWWIGSLGLAGIGLGILFPYFHRLRPLAWIVLGYSLSIVVFYVLSRFRVPIHPLIAGLGAGILPYGWHWFRQRLRDIPHSIRPFYLWFGSLVVGILIVTAGFQLYQITLEPLLVRWARPHGIWVELHNQYLIYDHGPFPFGGWTMQHFSNQVNLTKEFVLPQKIDFSSCLLSLSFPALSNQKGTILIETSTQQIPTALTPEIKDVVIQLNPKDYILHDGNRLILNLTIKNIDAEKPQLIFDSNRNYQRTQVNREPYSGEWVASLTIKSLQKGYSDAQPRPRD